MDHRWTGSWIITAQDWQEAHTVLALVRFKFNTCDLGQRSQEVRLTDQVG